MNTLFKNVVKRLLPTMLVLFAVSRADAASPNAIAGPVDVGPTEFLSVAGGLVAVIAAILLVSFLYSRMKGPRIGGNNIINIIASQALGPKERIVLIEVADTQLVIGMTTSHVQTLHVFDHPVIDAAVSTDDFSFAKRLKLALMGDRK